MIMCAPARVLGAAIFCSVLSHCRSTESFGLGSCSIGWAQLPVLGQPDQLGPKLETLCFRCIGVEGMERLAMGQIPFGYSPGRQ